MTTTSAVSPYRPPTAIGWWSGLANVFHHESRLWWRGRRWWARLAVWSGALTGILWTFLRVAARVESSGAGLGPAATDVGVVFPQFVGFAMTLSTIGIAVLTQGAMLDERRSGTLEWLLVKPVSRSGIVVGKYLAHLLAVQVVFVLGPWTCLYLLLSIETGAPWPAGGFLAAAGMAALAHAFTVALVTLLGTAFDSRALVVGVPIGAALLYDVVPVLLPKLGGRLPLPWELTGAIVQAAAGESIVSALPIAATFAWIPVVLAAAVWSFARQEAL